MGGGSHERGTPVVREAASHGPQFLAPVSTQSFKMRGGERDRQKPSNAKPDEPRQTRPSRSHTDNRVKVDESCDPAAAWQRHGLARHGDPLYTKRI